MAVYALTIFTGAFLLFLVQPLIGKYILPWFGGAPAVWTTCMLFFQMLLLCGYAYAHFSARWLKPRTQAILHLVLLAAALALLPITPADSWKPTDGTDPTLRILGLLLVSIGLPYFVVAATSPLMQHWFSRTNPGISPFRLYALSNIGSMLALLSFPVYFETQFTRTWQARLWGWGLVVYALACAACAVKLWRTPSKVNLTASDKESKSAALNPQPSTLNRLMWLLLPACASALLLATTNKICQDVAVIPFLWVLPLSLYLLSFILCFDNPRWYRRLPFLLALTASWGVTGWLLFNESAVPVNSQLIVYTTGLFICCMVCHGELYRLRPDPSHLTGYYLMIATGGALGGLFVAVIAPLIFSDYFELQWSLLLCGGLLLVLVHKRDHAPARLKFWRDLTRAWLALCLAAFAVLLWLQAHQAGTFDIEKSRNFYGVLTVLSAGNAESTRHLELRHGSTLHGLQLVEPSRAAWPTTYYSEKSGVGLALQALPAGNRRIGVVGLGAGTLAAYPQAGDYLRFYEINPAVERIATSRFTYLANCKGKAEVTLGDARLSLEREPPQNFDLLVLDAFNSDAIPVHLLTQEAFMIYERHVKTNGIIAVHVTNRGLDLEPVVLNVARQFDYRTVVIEYAATPDQWWISPSAWMLLSRNGENFDSTAIREIGRPAQTNPMNIRPWTDDYASLFQILRSDASADIEPSYAQEQIGKATSLCQQGNFAEAIRCYQNALQLHPNMPELLNNLAWLLITCPDAHLRNGAQAAPLAEKACLLTHYRTTVMVGTLAAAYAEAGRFDEAIWMAEKAVALATEAGEQPLVQKNQELLKLYRAHKPFHELPSPKPAETSAATPAPDNTEKLVPTAT